MYNLKIRIMALFKLFSSKQVANSDVIPMVSDEPQSENLTGEESAKEEKKEENAPRIITIKWGTGMPIDVIFNYIHKNYEDEGFQDALVNSDINYRDAKEKIIRSNLEMLFKRIILRYKNDIRDVEFKIDNARKAYALAAAAKLDTLRETYEEHLSEINDMQNLLETDDPKMRTMIESYRRGFLKGITASTLNFIENN